ncbi:MAG: GNAT family N-acetyltransferase [Leptolyngbya sp. SIOISBB]|nr:GNAT family N-acetyltransferase [Leptolyngbya sp. SIOISBB]
MNDVTGLNLRMATETDLPDILRLYQQPDLDDGKALPLPEAIAWFHKIQQYPSYQLLVAEWGDRIVGTLMLLVLDNLIHLGAPSGLVEAVAVDPHYHGQGIGRQMMHWAMAAARQSHCYKLVLSSSLTRDRAHAFYESLGFQQRGMSFEVTLAECSANTAAVDESQNLMVG